MVKNLPAVREIQFQSLGGEDSPGEWNDYHSSILICRIPWKEEPGSV